MTAQKRWWLRVGLSLAATVLFASKAMAQFTCNNTELELQCYDGGSATTGWSSAWQSFDTNGVSGKALD